MTCKELDRLVDTAPLRLRPARALQAARDHAATCPNCAVRLAEVAALERALGSLETIAPTSSLADGVMERVHMESRERNVVLQPIPEATGVGVATKEKLALTVIGGGALGLFGNYLVNLDGAAWLRSLLSPAVSLQGGNSWMMDPGTGVLFTAAGAILLTIGVLLLPGGPASNRGNRPQGAR